MSTLLVFSTSAPVLIAGCKWRIKKGLGHGLWAAFGVHVKVALQRSVILDRG
jgi:hypothetical protein